ncbi:MAG: hypothetical protein ACOZBH_04400 [Patescibacteria group bacterium]
MTFKQKFGYSWKNNVEGRRMTAKQWLWDFVKSITCCVIVFGIILLIVIWRRNK